MTIPGDMSDLRLAVDAPSRVTGAMGQPNSDPSPEGWLASAIIAKALSDATHGTGALRRNARQWLLVSDDLAFWCHLAGLNPATVRQLAADALASTNGGHR